ncbi:MAG: hypothetical protein QM820_32690 [Minicystis sp.]
MLKQKPSLETKVAAPANARDASQYPTIETLLARARKAKRAGGTTATLYADYQVDDDVAYLTRVRAQRHALRSQQYEGMGPALERQRPQGTSVDDIDVHYGGRSNRVPRDWEAILGDARDEANPRAPHLHGELGDIVERLAYKLDRIDAVGGFWSDLTAERERAARLRHEWTSAHQDKMSALERERRATLSASSGAGNSADRRMWAQGVELRKKAAQESWKAGKPEREEKLAQIESEAPERVKELARKRLEEHATNISGGQAPSRQQMIRARMELAGITLLPEPAPLGGLLPAQDYCVLDRDMPEASRHDALIEHANRLVRKYEVLDTDDARRALGKDDGCACIMFAEEEADDDHYVYIPFFGVSRGKRSAITTDQYMRGLGLPDLGAEKLDDAARARKQRMGKAGQRLMGRFLNLVTFFNQRRALGLKLPAKQAMLSYMQYMEKDWLHDPPWDEAPSESDTPSAVSESSAAIKRPSAEPAAPNALHADIAAIESWNSIQCAEPAAVMAAAQLYYRMADMDLSVPYEGDALVEPDDWSGIGWGKETCGRCAISEVRFAGVLESGARKQVKMLSVLMGDRESKGDEPEETFDTALGDDLRYNSAPKRPAYGPDPRNLDKPPKRDRQWTAMKLFHDLGLAQSSRQPFWMSGGKAPRPVRQPSPDAVPALIARLGLQDLFYDDEVMPMDANSAPPQARAKLRREKT